MRQEEVDSLTPEERQQVIDQVMPFLKQVVTQEQYQKSTEYINSLSDEEFGQLISEIIHRGHQEKPLSAKEYAKMTYELRKANGVTSENTALNDEPVHLLKPNENEELWDAICRTKPSDHIYLKGKDDQAICDLWRRGNSVPQDGIPSDLFFASHIPLLDCAITVDERDIDGLVCDYRVVVFEDYKDRIEAEPDDCVYVGAVVLPKGFRFSFMPIMVCKGVDMIIAGPVGWGEASDKKKAAARQHVTQQDLSASVYALLATWYGIQVALLHPTVKNIFQHPAMERAPSKGHKHRKRFVRYVKRHIIKAEDIEPKDSEFTRHTLVWYVIGHWRHYADGRKVFIQPYWKGALRDLKMNLDDREREIVTGGTR